MNRTDLKYLFTEDIYLIKSKEATESTPSKSEAEFPNVLVLVNQSIVEDDKNNLTKVLAAVNLKPDQVDIVDGSQFETFEDLTHSGYKTPVVLSFGIELWKSDPYQIHKQDQKTILQAEDLKTIFADRARKLKLWNALKKIFPQK